MDAIVWGSALGATAAAGFLFLNRRGRRNSGPLTFRERAEIRGLERPMIDLLERIAAEYHPERPTELLHVRSAFEHCVQQHVLGGGEAGELGFESLLDLAVAKERLGLRNLSERPTPFQRCTVRWRHRPELDPGVVVASGNHVRVVVPTPFGEPQAIRPQERCFLRYATPRQMTEIPMLVQRVDPSERGWALTLSRVAHDDPIGRTEPRCPVFVDAWISFPTEEQQGEFGTVYNLTEVGLLFETERRYPENARLRVRLNLGHRGVFSVEGTVRWSCPNVDGRWRHGFSFERSPSTELGPLRAYLRDARPEVSRRPPVAPATPS